MKRRDLLITGTALGGSGALSAFDRPALAQDAAGDEARSLVGPHHRYEISLRGTSLAVDCFPGTNAFGAQQHALDHGLTAPLAVVGDDERPLSWTALSWTESSHNTRALTLKAVDHPLEADISFTLDEATGFLVRRTVLRHGGGTEEIDLRATLGHFVSVHERIEQIFYLTGEWQEEAVIVRAAPGAGAVMLESRTGKTGFEFQPYVALRTRMATYLCQIFWSGNWVLDIDPREDGAVVRGGLNNWRFRHRLQAGESLELPMILFGRFEDNLDGATRRLHDYRRAHRPDPERPMPVQFNSWYPFAGEPSADALVPLIPKVKRLGCEVFVVDAGWYRTEDGESDADWDQRTGDWRVSRQRFPMGLRDISRRCRAAGLRFGLWFEPEVISTSSAIRRDHPTWLHHIDGKPPPPEERAVLNLGVPQAWHHVFDRITTLLRIIGIDWMKWDFNSDLGSGGWAPGLPADLTSEDPLIAHYRGLYRLQDAIRAAFPDLILEMCAGGAGRMDAGILSHAHVNWMSDQIGALRKLAIHFGIQLAHPAVVCNDWLIDWPGRGETPDQPSGLVDPRGDLAFRLRVAMLGTFGISAPIHHWPDQDLAVAAAHVALYKTRLRAIIHHGDRYALTRAPPPDGNGDWAALWYATKDGRSGVLFAFRLASADARRLFALRGLQKRRLYLVRFEGGRQLKATGETLEDGLAVTLPEAFRSALCLVEAIDA